MTDPDVICSYCGRTGHTAARCPVRRYQVRKGFASWGLLVAALGLLLGGCATKTVITDTSCRSFKPIEWSKLDTERTARQVIAHNRVYDRICPGDKG